MLAAAGGALIAGLLVHLYAAAALAAVVAERHLLADRVIDLEAALSQDAETASALRPLGDAMARLESHVDTLERDRVDQFAVVRTVLSRVESETAALGRQTQSLAGSLNAATVRGAWGEVQLKRVLEHAGMLARCDFDEQVSATNAHGQGVRPDVVVRLPGDKVLVIDAKAPMSAFLQTQVEDLDPTEAVRLLADHARALKSHVILPTPSSRAPSPPTPACMTRRSPSGSSSLARARCSRCSGRWRSPGNKTRSRAAPVSCSLPPESCMGGWGRWAAMWR